MVIQVLISGTCTYKQIYVAASLRESYCPENVVVGPPIGSSDHNSVYVKATSRSVRRQIKKCTFYDLRSSNVFAFEQLFLAHDFSTFYSVCDIDLKCKLFYDFMNSAVNLAIPKYDVYLTDFDAPWMTPFIKHLINKRWDAFRSRNWEVYNCLKTKIKKEILKAKAKHFERKSDSTKGMWSYVRMERGFDKTDPIVFLNKSEDSPDIEVLNGLNNYFCSVMSQMSPSPASLESMDAFFFCGRCVEIAEHSSLEIYRQS